MTGSRIYALFSLTWLLYVGSYAQEEIRLQCDDKNVNEAVGQALLKYNKELTAGSQLALYEIVEATKVQNGTEEVLSVQFTARESNCPAGGDKLWHECDYIQEHRTLRFCQATVLTKEANRNVSVECSVDPPSVRGQRPPCLGCPININLESEDIREYLSYSVAKANLEHNHPHFFILNSVTSATRQVIAGFRFRLQFDMQKSNCSKSEFKKVTEECHADQEDKMFINCNSTVDVAPWRHETPETNVMCAPGLIHGAKFSVRRRPPGWSPLRNIHNFAVVTPPKKKEESSEESQEGKPTAAPREAPARGPVPLPKAPSQEPAEASPPTFNCPSKPWKEFNPVISGPPPPPSNKTESDFKDEDLLG